MMHVIGSILRTGINTKNLFTDHEPATADLPVRNLYTFIFNIKIKLKPESIKAQARTMPDLNIMHSCNERRTQLTCVDR